MFTFRMQNHRALILRSNRFLGTTLVDKGLVSPSDLEAANEKFMQIIQNAELKRASILNILQYDLKVLKDEDLIDYMVEEFDIGLVDLNFIDLRVLKPFGVDDTDCWATQTIPFDKVENTFMLATCSYMSAPVVKHWEDKLGGPVVWFATSTMSMSQGLERVDAIAQAESESEDD